MSLHDQPWFFDVDKQKAEGLLLHHRNEGNSFLVRPSSSDEKCEFWLSRKWGGNDHKGIYKDKHGFYIEWLDKRRFVTVVELVEFLKIEYWISHPCRLDWNIPEADLMVGKDQLGEGSFGEVCKGEWNKRVVALKIVKGIENQNQEEFAEEVQNMQLLSHRNVVQFYGVCMTKQIIVLELMNGGSLENYLKLKYEELSLENLMKICSDVAHGMKYLEQEKFIHRDLATRNCLVELQGSGTLVKVADFGITRHLKKGDRVNPIYYSSKGHYGIPYRWCAPEVLERMKFSTKSDVWAYGVVLWEIFMMCHAFPYEDEKIYGVKQMLDYLKSGRRLPQPDKCPKAIYEFMKECWNDSPDQRPSFENIVDIIDGCIDYLNIIKKRTNAQINETVLGRLLSLKIEYRKCFFDVDKETAEILLLRDPHNDGSYLIRPSASEQETVEYIISYRKNNQVYHHKICWENNDRWHHQEDTTQTYETLSDLLSKFLPVADFKPYANNSNIRNKVRFENTTKREELYQGTWNEKDVLFKEPNRTLSYKKMLNEAKILHNLSHPNIITLYAVYMESIDSPRTVFESIYADFKWFLFENKNDDIPIDKLIKFSLDIAHGMKYLEQENIIHRNLGCYSCVILKDRINQNWTVKLSDFYYAKKLNGSNEVYHDDEDIKYLWPNAPEVKTMRNLSTKSDVWLYGVVLWEIFTWCDIGKYIRLKEYFEENGELSKPPECPEEIFKIILGCFRRNPIERPSFENIFETISEYSSWNKCAINGSVFDTQNYILT